MRVSFFKTRFVLYVIFLALVGTFLFNFLLARQSAIMYKYFIERPAAYNAERAERLSSSIYESFKGEVSNPTFENIRNFTQKYDDIPFLSVNFLYKGDDGVIRCVLDNMKETEILDAEYVFPVKQGAREIGTLLVYNINKEYKKGLEEYDHMLFLTRTFFVVLLVLLLFILFYREYNQRVEEQKCIAEYQAKHDGLTGLFTHKHFKEELAKEIQRSERYKYPLSLAMCDIDHFKKFNDTYGHLFGDEVLKIAAGVIRDNIRTSDIVARYGGEEFVMLFIGRKEGPLLRTEAVDTARRIKRIIESTKIKLSVGEDVGITISMGLSFYEGGKEKGYKPEYFISEADLALYKSKDNGRNRLTVFDPNTEVFTEYA